MVLTVATVNVNGIRAAQRRGMDDWIAKHQPDLLALQEVRAPAEIADEILGEPWHSTHAVCEAKGRAGVSVAARSPILSSIDRLDPPASGRRFDGSGRWIEATVTAPDQRPLTLVSAYVHTGDADDEHRMSEKLGFMESMVDRLEQIRAAGGHVVLSGDLNVAHHEVDIKNWKGNRGKAGFLVEERAYLDELIDRLGWCDLGRRHGGDGPGPYTWWSWRGQAFDTDAGWRIDYLITTPELADRAVGVSVHRAPSYAERWSDHAPLVATFDFG